MAWLYLAILAHFIFAVVFIFDKIIVKKLSSPIKYVFIIGGFESLAILLMPFVDFFSLDAKTLAVIFLSGISSIGAIYFYFKVLLRYEASWVVPVLFGVVVPMVTFILGQLFLVEKVGFFQVVAFSFLLVGGIILSFGKRYDFKSFLLLVLAGSFAASELFLLKIAFGHTDFITGYTVSRFSGFITAGTIFLIVNRNKRSGVSLDFSKIKEFIFSSIIGIATLKQILSFAGSLILVYAVSIGNLTLVSGLGGIRYAFVLVLALLLSWRWPTLMDEPINLFTIVKKTAAISLIVFGVLILLIQPAKTPGAKIWGVTFTDLYSKELGLDGKEVLTNALDDLRVREFRIVAYWPEIEKTEGVYDFSDLDFQVNAIKSRGGKMILAVGKRLPRWPECHEPEWKKNQNLTSEQTNDKILKYVEATINRYKDEGSIWAWQMENEPFLFGFGECHYVDDEFLDEEISLIKRLDSSRPVLLTDSGEFGVWFRAYKRADIFGPTMYRVVLSSTLPIGYFKYPLDPDYFRIKAEVMRMIFGDRPILGAELQAEPWLKKRPPNVPLDEQFKAFDLEQFKENIEYAKQVGFERNYLWGVEWWYWMKVKQDHPEFWEETRRLFNQ